LSKVQAAEPPEAGEKPLKTVWVRADPHPPRFKSSRVLMRGLENYTWRFSMVPLRSKWVPENLMTAS